MGTLVMPRLGETVTEGTVIRWLKQEGEQIAKDEMVVEISTDKVDMEIPSPDSGVLEKILIDQGSKVAVGTGLAVIGKEAETPEPTRKQAGPKLAEARPVEPSEPASERSKVKSPIVRKLAKENQVDLSLIAGTGAAGRITKADVLAFMESKEKPPVPARPPADKTKPGRREDIVPLGHIRKMIAEHMVRSARTSAHVTTVIEVDMEPVVSFRQARKAAFKEREGFSLTYLPFICRAAIEALGRFPRLNATLDGDNLILKRYVNLGIAVSITDGLIVPVIKDADGLNIVGLARAIHELADKARSGSLRPDDVHEGTFTITNPGVFGTIFQTPIINQPQVGILSLDAIYKRPVVIDTAIAIRHMVYLSLSYDHRANDGAVAAQFLRDIKDQLESGDMKDDI